MAIAPGSRFGSYEIVEPIGAGGMGEVWRAHDATLKRDVALKVLPPAFVADADRLARFQREAEILASLNHPHIAQVYGLEQADGVTAIVMELVEGPTLGERIKQGPISPDEAMAIALQVAAALEAAHARQIVHRDLKPDNIKLKDDGTVKVLDFGISKPINPAAISGGSPVMTTPAVTQTGVILGTAAYMSPEQARGKFVDERTDIWAFGCLLFEMLTGQPAFGGEDVMLTLARVLDRATDLSSIPQTISPAVRHTIKLCLEKNPKDRLADIRDVRLALEGRLESELPRESSGVAGRSRAAWLGAPAAALMAGAALAAVVAAVLWPEAEPREVTRFTIAIPTDQALRGPQNRFMGLSADGRRIVYNTTDGFYVRGLDALEAVLVPGTTGDLLGPMFAGDEDILYGRVTSAGLTAGERIAIGGGPPTVVADPDAVDISQIPDARTILPMPMGSFLISHRGGVSTFDSAGNGRFTRVVDLGDDRLVSGARLLPDGDTIVFAATQTPVTTGSLYLNSTIMAASLSGAFAPAEILARGLDPRYLAATGHLLFLRDGAVHAVAFDAVSLSVAGEVRTVLPDVRQQPLLVADYDVAENGTLAYFQGQAAGSSIEVRLSWLYADGRVEALPFAPPRSDEGRLRFAVLSPDGTKLAAAVTGEDLDIYVYDLLRSGTRTLIAGADVAEPKAVWMPDGESLIFYRRGQGLFQRAADASDRETLVLAQPPEFEQMIPDWVSPDGTELGFTAIFPDDRGIYRLSLTEGAEPEIVLDEPGVNETTSALSPDGRYLAYTTDETGTEEIHIRPYPAVTSGRTVVSPAGGSDPKWSDDGVFLSYLEGSVAGRVVPGSLLRVSVATDAGIVIGEPEVVADQSILVEPVRPNYVYDSSADRWLVYALPTAGTDADGDLAIVVVENWTEWLKQEVPVD